jgi:hypothetical protein
VASREWIQWVYADLQMAGFSRGGARDAVIDLLGEQECALSATQIDRVLDLLVERGLV